MRELRDAFAHHSPGGPAEEILRGVMDCSADCIKVIGLDGRLQYVSRGGLRALEIDDVGPFLGRQWLDLWAGPYEDQARAALEAARRGRDGRFQGRVPTMKGTPKWWDVVVSPIFGKLGHPEHILAISRDITVQHDAAAALRETEERYRLAVRATSDAVWDWDLASDELRWGDADEPQFGYGPDQIGTSGAWWKDALHPDDHARVIAGLYGKIDDGSSHWSAEYRFRRRDGSYAHVLDRGYMIRDAVGRAVRMVGAMLDLTDRKAAEEQLWKAANQDPLTGLANRASFQRQFDECLREAARCGESLSLLLIDSDNFKDINDTLGHDAGDTVLREIADRLRLDVSGLDIVARLGGDEFAVVVRSINDVSGGVAFAEHLLRTLRKPFPYHGRTLELRASIGVASFPAHAATSIDLLKCSDIALYQAKGRGRNQTVVYSEGMRRSMEQRIALVNAIRGALKQDAIVPFYQPVVDLQADRVVGFEALARWRHPVRGIISAGEFASAFQDPEIAVVLGRRMMARVADDIRGWTDQGLDCGRVAINLSPAEFRQPDLVERIAEMLQRAGVHPRHIEIEITETVLLESVSSQVLTLLERFHRLGISVALDDFGTGFGSLAHLKRFPIDRLKIDKSFVRDLEHDTSDAAIVSAVIGLGRNLDLDVIAEGVETEAQAEHLKMQGCALAQGFLYAKPMVGSRVPDFLRRRQAQQRRRAARVA